jgi:hypothetical protein
LDESKAKVIWESPTFLNNQFSIRGDVGETFGKFATLTDGLAHDVSILLGVARHFGWQPRAKTSIIIVRAPQRGHGQGSTHGFSGVLSGGSCGSAAGEATLRSVRAVSMLSARLALAENP